MRPLLQFSNEIDANDARSIETQKPVSIQFLLQALDRSPYLVRLIANMKLEIISVGLDPVHRIESEQKAAIVLLH
jgi:hypothetical protein